MFTLNRFIELMSSVILDCRLISFLLSKRIKSNSTERFYEKTYSYSQLMPVYYKMIQ